RPSLLLQLCANLDTWCIMSPQNHHPQLPEHNQQPNKQYDLCQRRSQDPFGDLLKKLMDQVHDYLGMPELSRDFGTQTYEQQVVELSETGESPEVPEQRLYAARPYCEAGLARGCDLPRAFFSALLVLALGELSGSGQPPSPLQSCEHHLPLTPPPRLTPPRDLRPRASVWGSAADHKDVLAHVAAHGPENPKLERLEEVLQEQFGSPGTPRGIIFTRTRQSAHCLLLWVQQQPGLQNLNVRAQMLIGAGNSSQSTHMTQREQQDIIWKFRDGTLNLLVATSVAEEGLDIPQCSVVVRYGLLTNEISMVQARGRARASQSVYSFMATEGSQELRRELTNEMLEALMEQAVAAVQKMDPAEYQAKIQDLQRAALVKRAAQVAQQESQQQQFLAEHVQLFCISCMVAVGHGSDLRKVEGTHHVNVNPNFSIYYNVSRKPVVIDRVFKDWRPGGAISCKNCGEVWGLQMMYKSVKLPVLKVRSMLLETPQGRVRPKKWSRVPFPVLDFDFLQHCAQSLADLSLN
ncbi:probable ATP-dependent RNA helicase DHX58, partial [Carlito syrichta]|uniref:RNA helicase n=1 Tax=Carlito syrichta TaxID=1868482 RepID=A0A1U7UM38_CARSF